MGKALELGNKSPSSGELGRPFLFGAFDSELYTKLAQAAMEEAESAFVSANPFSKH